MKFTFKTEKPTGKYASFNENQHYIKLNKKEVGSIIDTTWEIHLMVEKKDINEDGNPNCSWKWITLEAKPKDLNSAKEFLNIRINSILKKYTLHFQN